MQPATIRLSITIFGVISKWNRRPGVISRGRSNASAGSRNAMDSERPYQTRIARVRPVVLIHVEQPELFVISVILIAHVIPELRSHLDGDPHQRRLVSQRKGLYAVEQLSGGRSLPQ